MRPRVPDPTTIEMVDTDYPDRPSHRGHTVEIQGWNADYVMLVIRSDGKTNEALISPSELMKLAERAVAEGPKW